MQIQQDRPPFVRFERRPVEKQKPIAEGGARYVDEVDFALITPIGDKDTRERDAQEWLAFIEQQVREERFPAPWLEVFRQRYKAFCDGQEMPISGDAIRSWPAASPKEIAACVGLNILTVEDLAALNEAGLARLGMGGRDLKARAVAYMAAKSGPAAVAQEITGLKTQVSALMDQVNALMQVNAQLRMGAASGTVAPEPLGDLDSRLANAQSGVEDMDDLVERTPLG